MDSDRKELIKFFYSSAASPVSEILALDYSTTIDPVSSPSVSTQWIQKSNIHWLSGPAHRQSMTLVIRTYLHICHPKVLNFRSGSVTIPVHLEVSIGLVSLCPGFATTLQRTSTPDQVLCEN